MANLLDYALTTLNDVKESLGIEGSDTSWDNLIKRKINQATEIIEGYTGRRFKLTTYTDELYEGNNGNELLLRNYPIVGSVTLSARDTYENDNDFNAIDANQFFIDSNSGVIEGLGSFYGGFGRWKVTYAAGYATIPSDVAEAAATLASYLTVNDPATSANVSMKREGARQIQFTNNQATTEELLDQLGIKLTLDRYTNTVLSGQI